MILRNLSCGSLIIIFGACLTYYAREMGGLFFPMAGYSLVKSPFDFPSTVLNATERDSGYKERDTSFNMQLSV